jgi:hypothetical protein
MYKIQYNSIDLDKDEQNVYDISKLKRRNIKKNLNEIYILINMTEDKKVLKKYIKKFVKYRKLLYKAKKCEILINGYLGTRLHKDFVELIEASFLINKRYIYERAYDIACDYLDNQFYGKNLCDFCNNKCGYKKKYNIEVGCCRHYEKHKQLGLMLGEKLVKCEYLANDGHCTIKCMGCKLFTCSYLENKGIKFKIKDILALDSIFNIPQKIILKSIVYTPKEEIINKIMFL